MSLKRILFVDDEQNVLEGLQNLLRKHRKRWDMAFALGGPAALAEFEKAPFDVVVTDMRMPGMDGAALLEIVKDRYPGVARIVLSGHAEQEAAVRALRVAHRFLSKPCDAETLQLVIEQTVQLQALLTDAAVRKVVGRLDRLPSVPRTYHELMKVTADPSVGIADVAKIIERDSAMSVKVLQIVNSAYFGLAQKTTSVNKAVVYLGIDLLKGLALVSNVFATIEASPVEGFSLDRLQQHSLLTAKLAKQFVRDQARAEEAFTAGLVHDVGEIIVALSLPDGFREVLHEARKAAQPTHVIEKERLGLTHAELGGYLLGVWGLPYTVVEAVAYHHTPSLALGGQVDVLAAVHVAESLIDHARFGEKSQAAESTLDLPFLEKAGLSSQLPVWRAFAEQETADLELAK